ncbi:MAG: tetratricopeptide repeat protein [Pedobacter sp.]|nr:tetratricopeptide repeat protein [Pedobacter sp.]
MSLPESIPVSPALLALNLAGRNEAEAARLLTSLADQGNADAQAMLGQFCLDGRGMDRDATQALNWFRLAAAQNHVMAINMLGRCQENGWGCVPDISAALSNYRRAAEAGLDWGQYNYANLLRMGRGTEPDTAGAFELYMKAAEQGHAKAMNLVGRFHHEGWAMPVNEAEAEQWYCRSAEGGDFRGQISYAGVLAEQGKITESVAWLREAMKTAIPSVLEGLSQTLLQSPEAAFREVGEEMRTKARNRNTPPA